MDVVSLQRRQRKDLAELAVVGYIVKKNVKHSVSTCSNSCFRSLAQRSVMTAS